MKQEELTDRALISKILGGNTRAFKRVIDNTQGLVINIVFKMISDPEEHKDLIQEIYLKAFDKLASFKFDAKLSTWIGTISYNTCINHCKKKKIPIIRIVDRGAEQQVDSMEYQSSKHSQIQFENEMLRGERKQILQKEIEKLSPIFRTIVTLYHNEELSYKEIQLITGLNEGTLKSYLYRARKQLKDNLLAKYKKEDL